MNDFRSQVSAIMAGVAPDPSIIPATDSANRPTLRRGCNRRSRQDHPSKAVAPAEWYIRMPLPRAAVKAISSGTIGLVPDGIVGPRTWATIVA